MKKSLRFGAGFLLALFLMALCAFASAEDQHGKTDAEWAEWKKSNAEHPSYMLHFKDEWPAEMGIDDAVKGAGYQGAAIIDGYASRRFGDWQFAVAILQDKEGYILLCASYKKNQGAWSIEASRKALLQGELPTLLPEGAEYGYDDYDVSQSDGCSTFKLVYPDITYRWMNGTWGFMIIEAGDMGVAPKTISRWPGDGTAEYAFNTQSVKLTEFDLSLFPANFEAARAAAEASPYADKSKGVTTHSKALKEEALDDGTDVPHIALLEKPEENSAVKALVYDCVEVSVLETRGEYVQVAIGALSGWIGRDCLLIGAERAAEWSWKGCYAQVYAYGGTKEQPLYQAASEKSAKTYTALLREMIYVQAMTTDGSWYLVRTEDGTLGWMPFDTVSDTSNFYDAWIYSKDGTKRLNLRKGPGKEYESIGRYYSGVHVVNLLTHKAVKGWSHVIIEGVSGWVDNSFLVSWAGYGGLEWLPPLRKVSVKGGECPVYPSPDKGNAPLEGRTDGTYAEIMGVVGSWAHARFRDGTSGYVELKYLGGEPKEADKNSFTLKKDIAQSDYSGNKTGDILKKGTKIRILERPASYWQGIWSEELGKTVDQEFVENPLMWVRTLSTKEETGAYLNADDMNFWGK